MAEVLSYYKYVPYKKTEYDTVVKNVAVEEKQKITDVSIVVKLGGVFEEIGGNDESIGGGNQKVGSANKR